MKIVLLMLTVALASCGDKERKTEPEDKATPPLGLSNAADATFEVTIPVDGLYPSAIEDLTAPIEHDEEDPELEASASALDDLEARIASDDKAAGQRGGEQFIRIAKPGKIADIDFSATSGIARFSLNSPADPLDQNGNRSEEFTLVVYNVSETAQPFSVLSVDSAQAPSSTGALRKPLPAAGQKLSRPTTTSTDSDTASVARATALIRNGALNKPYRRSALSLPTLAVGNEVEFKVKKSIEDQFAGETVSGVLHALGKYVALYVDRDIPIDMPNPADPTEDLDPKTGLPKADTAVPFSGGFSRASLRKIAKIFDNNIYPLETSIYGKPPNVDGDQRISVLITPRVNGLRGSTPPLIPSYIDTQDLLPYDPVRNPGSNEQEIIFMHAPDPCGFYFPKKTVDPLSYTQTTMLAWLAIQLQKLISFNQHVILNKSTAEEDWIDFGLGLLAADLSGFGGMIYRDLKLKLLDMPNHDKATLKASNALPDMSNIRNAHQYLFFRYLADRFGTPIFKDLFGHKTGVANIESAVAAVLPGTTFKDLFRDYNVAMLLSGTGLVSSEDKDRFEFKRPVLSSRFGTVGYQTGVRLRGINGSNDGDSVFDPFEDRNGNGAYEPNGADGVAGTIDDELSALTNDTDTDGFDDGFELDGLGSDYCSSLNANANYLDMSLAKNKAAFPKSTLFDDLKLGTTDKAGLFVYNDRRAFATLLDSDGDGLTDLQESVFYITPDATCNYVANWKECFSPLMLAEASSDAVVNFYPVEKNADNPLWIFGLNMGSIMDNNGNGRNDIVADVDHSMALENHEYPFLTLYVEDVNFNRVLELGEDENQNGSLDIGIDFDDDGLLSPEEIINTSSDTIAKRRFIPEKQCLSDLGYPATYKPLGGVAGDINGNGRIDDLIFDVNSNGRCDTGEDKHGSNANSGEPTEVFNRGADDTPATTYDNETSYAEQDYDHDGWADGVELRLGSNPNDSTPQTSNPGTLKDSDQDGLPDLYETQRYKTDPLKVDSDGDGFDDNTEISIGSDPTDATKKPRTEGSDSANTGYVYVGNLNFNGVGAQVMTGPHEEYFTPGESYDGYVAPFTAAFIRIGNLKDYQVSLIIKGSPQLRAAVVKQNPVCATITGCQSPLDPTIIFPYNPRRVFLESSFGSLMQQPNTDRSLPTAQKTGANTLPLLSKSQSLKSGGSNNVSPWTLTMVSKIDPPSTVDVQQLDFSVPLQQNREVPDVDKYAVDIPPLSRVEIWVNRKLEGTNGQAPLNPIILMARAGDVPQVGIPDDLRSGIAIPPFPAVNSAYVAVPNPLLGPLAQFPKVISETDYNARLIRTPSGRLSQGILDLTGGDADLDGLQNDEEMFKHRTNPRNPDTDGDGYSDGWEFGNNYDPTNKADNPYIKKESLSRGIMSTLTKPEENPAAVPPEVDEDEDYLLYSKEDTNGNNIYESELGETCPNVFVTGCSEVDPGDTDGDGYSDGFERQYNSDPNNDQDIPTDIDIDNLPNCAEEPMDYPFDGSELCDESLNQNAGGSDRIVGTYDDVEGTGSEASLYAYDKLIETSAINPDSDFDGIDDGDEINGAIIRRNTGEIILLPSNPLQSDTDGDGFHDGVEIGGNSDPASYGTYNFPMGIDLREFKGDPFRLPGIPRIGLVPPLADVNASEAIVMEQIRDCHRDPFVKDPKSCGVFDPERDADPDSIAINTEASYSIDLSNFAGGQSANDFQANAMLVKDVLYGGKFFILVGGEGSSSGGYTLHVRVVPHHSFTYTMQRLSIFELE